MTSVRRSYFNSATYQITIKYLMVLKIGTPTVELPTVEPPDSGAPGSGAPGS